MRKVNIVQGGFFIILGVILLSGCKKEGEGVDEELPAVYQKFYNIESVYQDGDFVVIETAGIPDHKSPYYEGTSWESELYETYTGSNPDFVQNPNDIAAQDYTFKIPINPGVDGAHSSTPLGPIGVALNGVAIFNQYAGPGEEALEGEINTFDQFNGHPTGTKAYHYHIEPVYLTSTLGSSALIGFLLDGFPVYGPIEDGELVTNDDLDTYHGHSHATFDYPDGIYHYHITAEDPYINGDGFYGTAGTVTQ
ncbi:MAG: YHYH protein [Crocinitomix sp.]|nr:YHYH protein [Crocinitomix sp.]